MKIFGDWKFAATLFVAIAGVVVPVWLWQADLSSKSLSITLTTRVSLQPTDKESLQGMAVSVDGKSIENPYLVVIEIANDGSKPILASDFESPLDIRLASDTYFVRSRITKKEPKDIDTDISSDTTSISIKPTLLNPKDSVTVTIVTAGIAPVFETRARVAGIPSIAISDNTVKKRNTARLIFLAVAAAFLSIASSVASDGAFSKNGILLRRRAAVFVGIVCALPSVVALITLLEELELAGILNTMLFYTLMVIPAGLIASVLNRKQSESQSRPELTSTIQEHS